MQPLLVPLIRVVAARQAALVARSRVLVGLDAAVGGRPERADGRVVLLAEAGPALLPAEGEVRRRHDLDEVHVVVVDVVRLLAGAVEGVEVVVGPGEVLVAELLVQVVGQLGAEAQLVDLVREGVLGGRVPVVLEVVHVHVAVAEAAAGRDVEVAHDLVHPQPALDAAPLLALLVQPLAEVLALALLDALTPPEGPRLLRVGVLDLVARVAAAGLLGGGRRVRAVAGAAVRGVEVGCALLRGVPLSGC